MNDQERIALSHKQIRKHWKSVMVEATLFLILGVLAFTLPIAFKLSFELVLGWIFLAAGTMQLYRTAQSLGAPGTVFMTGSCLLAMVFGVMLLFDPLEGLLAVTFIVGVYFLIESFFKFGYAYQVKDYMKPTAVLFSAVITLLFGIFVLAKWPISSMWFTAGVLGLYLFMNGLTLFWAASNATQGESHGE